ncbi:Glycosylphosphatidylinositol (GPI) anchor assembly protein [Coniosporium apollinis]|uniref:Glycosylphosphatidylinositol (GPI) anchor assembly protein n=1 Tax=Coniosporium apollinis TaxID=61459 RepID=A0ABQ9NKS3_9PEZI|nr:Glycosylphosphatidylinositol (GPI) anchor assembly protein [Coniosporium apollinis]
MSSTTTITKPPTSQPASSPVELLNIESARWYTRLHPGLVLAVYAIQFQAIVADPVSALLRGLLPLCILQIAYVAICLPPTGATSTPAPKPGSRRSKQPPSALGRTLSLAGSVANRTIVPAFLSLVLAVIAGAPLLFTTLVLFGAPFIYVHGVDSGRWREIVSLLHPMDEVYGAALGTLLGAWVGAIPIPLDWDREWQKWPVTIVTGAYIGFAAGKLAGGMLFRGKVVKFDKQLD